MFDNLRLDNQLCFALYAATHAITRTYRPLLGDVGLTYPQYLVMLVLWESDKQSVQSLATTLELDSATLTPLLKRMETAKLVSRKRKVSDERVVEVSLTDKGKQLEAEVAKIQEQVACQTQLNQAEFTTLCNTLHQLTKTMTAQIEKPAINP